MSRRKIVVDGVEWNWKVGSTYVSIRSDRYSFAVTKQAITPWEQDIERAQFKGAYHITPRDISDFIKSRLLSTREKVEILKDVFDNKVIFSYQGTSLAISKSGRIYRFSEEVKEPEAVKAWMALCYMKWHRPWSPFYRQYHKLIRAHHPELRNYMIKAMLNDKDLVAKP